MSQRRIPGTNRWRNDGPAHVRPRDALTGYGSISAWWLTADPNLPPDDRKALTELKAAADRGRAVQRRKR